jgi:hypothetical protein
MTDDVEDSKPPAVNVGGDSIAEVAALSELQPPQPSSVHAEIDEDEDDEEPQPPSSVHGEMDEDDIQTTPFMLPTPHQPELTLKEKLVLRERQRRIETERARLKRQFALNDSSSTGAANIGESNSLDEGTLGDESIRAHPDEESAGDDARRLGFNMERFLRNSDSFNPQLETMQEDPQENVVMERFLNDPVVVVPSALELEGAKEASQGMSSAADQYTQRTVSFDVDAREAITNDALPTSSRIAVDGSVPSLGEGSVENASVVSNVSVQDDVGMIETLGNISAASMDVEGGDVASRSSASHGDGTFDELRVFRLTEADIREVESIAEASIGNAPPSERDEEDMLSEIGELADFGGTGHGVFGGGGETAVSQDTPTTAMESASQMSGNQSQRSAHVAMRSAFSSASAEERHRDVDDVAQSSDHDPHSICDDMKLSPVVSPSFMLSPIAGISVVANPPTSIGRDEDLDEHEVSMHVADGSVEHQDDASVEETRIQTLQKQKTVALVKDDVSANENGQVGEQRILGLVNRPRHSHPPGLDPVSLNNNMQSSPKADTTLIVEGFDFDKDAPQSPFAAGESLHADDSLRDLPSDPWSPGGVMNVSPLHSGARRIVGVDRATAVPQHTFPATDISYGAVEEVDESPLKIRMQPPSFIAKTASMTSNETTPLLAMGGDIPPEIITRTSARMSTGDQESNYDGGKGHGNRRSWAHLESAISEVRSEDETEKRIVLNECEIYNASNVWARAFPERQFALMVTLIFEIPVLFMITGGSDALCSLIGRSRYQLLVGFIPLTSAISGNVGLQASTLTTRAISHLHVTASSYMPWFLHEVGAAACLGIGMGFVLGSVALFASGLDVAFAATIFVAQFISIVTAGITGTFAPLLFSFIFRQDSGKWSGPLETAIQDIVGSFAMVVISYRILEFFGPYDIDPDDLCMRTND